MAGTLSISTSPLSRLRLKTGVLALASSASLAFGCASIPKGAAAVDGVNVEGNKEVSGSDITDKMATTSSPKFLELFRGLIYDYSFYDRTVLQRDLERVERYYRARGFYEAKARAARVRATGKDHVEVTVEVDEGSPVLVGGIRIDGLSGLSQEDAAAVREAAGDELRSGVRFEEQPFQRAETAMKRALTDRGRAFAAVERRADVDLPQHRADLFFVVRPGPKATFGPIRIEGLGDLPEDPVRRALDIAPGDPYSTREIESAQQAAVNLGTFSSVEITPELDKVSPLDKAVPLRVHVERQKLKTVLLGGGIEIDSIRADTHLHAGWEHKNLFGGFRHFTVDFRPGIHLYPTRIPTFEAPTAVLPKERLSLQLRQPGFIEARTTGVLTQELNTYPVLLSPVIDPAAPVLGYLEYKGSAGLERTLRRLFGALTYDVQYNQPFAYLGKLDPDLSGVLISYLDLLARFDLRDDTIRPHKGVFAQADVQFAGLGGDARDFRIQPEIRGYVPLGKRVTLAARSSVGFLFPMTYGDASKLESAAPGSADRAAWIKDIELIYLRGFFSGGPGSNRGYPLRGVGPHGAVPFFNPGLQAQALASACEPTSPNFDAIRCAVPLGGLSLWEASLEVRFPIAGDLGGTVFCDASDVSPKQLDLRFDHPHLSCGLGARYDTPIGPVRLDVGYRIPGLQVLSAADPVSEGDPGSIAGLPLAIAFGIGEAF